MSKKTRKALVGLLIKLAVVAAVVAGVLIFVFDIHPLHGNYMYPALRDGDLCISYKLGNINLNDAVVYERDGEVLFGRIIGMPGDEIHIDNENFTINGMLPSESIYYETHSDKDIETVVRDGEYFILNDFRSDTNDSRENGCVSADELKGKVSFVFRRRGF